MQSKNIGAQEANDKEELYLNTTEVTLEAGESYQLFVAGFMNQQEDYIIYYEAEDSSIAWVNDSGYVTGYRRGTTIINVMIEIDYETYQLNCIVNVTSEREDMLDLQWSKVSTKDRYIIRGVNTTYQFAYANLNSVEEWYEHDYSSSNEAVAYVDYNGVITPLKKGTAVIKDIITDERGNQHCYSITIRVTNPLLNRKYVRLAPGKKLTLQLRGASGKTTVKWKSSNAKVATVTSKGVVTAKKLGNVTISVTVDGKTIRCNFSVANAKAIKASAAAEKAVGSKYSQAKRMQKGYYDCSSLVWRCYKPYGVNFGVSGNWAPVASNEAKYMVKKKKAIAYKGITESKLLPGDILFFANGYNGKYLNIYHTGIYVGNGRIVHADGKSVTYRTYSSYKNKICLIARPTKE